MSGRLLARPMPGVRPGGRPTFLCEQESRQRNRPCKTAPAGCPAMLEAQGRAELASLRSAQTSGAKSVLEARFARALGFCASRRFRRGGPQTAEQPTAKPESRSPRGIPLPPSEPAEKRRALRPRAQLASRTDSTQLFEQSVAARVLRGGLKDRASQGSPLRSKGPGGSGAVSLVTFLGVQESDSPAGAKSPLGLGSKPHQPGQAE